MVLRSVLITAAAGTALLTVPVLAQTKAPVAAATTPPVAADAPNPDPWEPLNRRLYKLNKGLDRAFIRPSAVFYQHAFAHPIREGIHNIIYNLGEPVTFINNVVQLHPVKAGKTVVRFAVNSTVGVAGVFDVTGANGLAREPSGFADTLSRYGAPQGPYIFLPVFGPSSARDLSGRIVDIVTDPFNYIKYSGQSAVDSGRSVAAGLDQRVDADDTLKDVNRTATDPYATLRSGYLQSAEAETHDNETNVKSLPDFGPEPGGPPPGGRPSLAPPPPASSAPQAAVAPPPTDPS